jgi:hypothetical protein
MTMTTLTVLELKDKYPSEFKRKYEKWREHAACHNWWDGAYGVYETAKEEAKPLGFRIDAIWFSGFWSQGDGACWEGSVDLPKFLAAKNSDDPRWHVIIELIRNDWLASRCVIAHSGRYYHENTMSVSYENDFDPHDETAAVQSGPYVGASVLELYDAAGGDSTINELADWVEEEARDYARGIYKDLEEEYEYLTSEEQFIEHCECNDVKFDVEEDEFGYVTVEEV